jgi:hypothetical protein
MNSKNSSCNKENSSPKSSSLKSVASFERNVLKSIGNSSEGYSGHRPLEEYNSNTNSISSSSKKQRQY